METRYTPAPWMAINDRDTATIHIGKDGGGSLAKLSTGDTAEDLDTQEANARLIAAAPDLLGVALSVPHGSATPQEWAAWEKKRKDAILKAEGK